MGYMKEKQREALENPAWDEQLGPYTYTSEQDKAALDVVLKRLEKEERENVIEYYIMVTGLSLVMLGLGFMLGSVFV